MKISVSLAKLLESLTGYSAPKSVCTCWWGFLQVAQVAAKRQGGNILV